MVGSEIYALIERLELGNNLKKMLKTGANILTHPCKICIYETSLSQIADWARLWNSFGFLEKGESTRDSCHDKSEVFPRPHGSSANFVIAQI
jgi:hypothetical protein